MKQGRLKTTEDADSQKTAAWRCEHALKKCEGDGRLGETETAMQGGTVRRRAETGQDVLSRRQGEEGWRRRGKHGLEALGTPWGQKGDLFIIEGDSKVTGNSQVEAGT